VSVRREERMSVEPIEELQRVPMPLEEFLALPEGTRAEYSDGVAIMSPPARMGHNSIGFRLAMTLHSSLPDLHVGYEMGVELGSTRLRQPDIAVVDADDDSIYTQQTPHLVVEVLSPSTRGEDLVRKSHEYAEAGIGQYWVIDREARRITIYGRNGTGWDVLLELTDAEPAGEVQVVEHGTVALDLRTIITR